MRRAPGLVLALAALASLAPMGAIAAPPAVAPEVFIAETFAAPAPRGETLTLDEALRGQVRDVLGHAPGFSKARYWREGARSAWILEEIGKTRPITVGIVVDRGHIERLRVLAYRESHGWEVGKEFFTRQFSGATLGDGELDRRIDNISGATLSVNATRKLARLALLFDAKLQAAAAP